MDRKEEIDTKKSKILKDKVTDQKRATISRKVRSRLPNIAKIVVFTLVFTSILIIMTRTSLFDIEGSEITDDIGDAPAYIELAGVKTFIESEVYGQNFFLFNPTGLEERLIEKFPFIENVWIEKIFPNSILVRVEEKRPLLVVENDTDCMIIDSNGELIRNFKNDDEEEAFNCANFADQYEAIHTIFGKGIYDTLFSGKGFFLFEQIFQAKGIIEDLGMEISRVDIVDRIMYLNLTSGRVVILDPFKNYDDQLKRMVLVFNQTEYQGDMGEVDLRYERPVVRP